MRALSGRGIFESLVRLELRSSGEIAGLRRPVVRRTRFLWRHLPMLLQCRAAFLVVRGLYQLIEALRPGRKLLSVRIQPRALRDFLDRVGPRRRGELAARIVVLYPLRLLRRFDQYLESEERRAPFLPLGHVTIGLGGLCNLRCADCATKHDQTASPAPIERVRAALRAADEAGAGRVSFIGPGEPLLDREYGRELLQAIAAAWRLEVILFTNGTLIDEDVARRMGALSNLAVLVSVDGLPSVHDARRGPGAFARAAAGLRNLAAARVPCGFSVTVHGRNWIEVTSAEFLESMAGLGCLAGVYNELFPFEGPEGGLPSLSTMERAAYLQRFQRLSAGSSVLLLEFRTAEAARYGCRARKGTSCHMDAVSGKVSPCVLFPYSSANAIVDAGRPGSLERILRTSFFEDYRRGYDQTQHCGVGVKQELRRLLENPFLSSEDQGAIRARLARLTPPDSASNVGSDL